MTDQPNRLPAHLYVPQGHFPAPVNINEPKLVVADAAPARAPSHLYVAPQKTCAGVSRAKPLHVMCNLPERLPILPAEIAIIEAYLGDIIRSLAANDNEPQR
ncbi:MAG: hypothetical protein SFV19_16935 [Rhodospirillaceae bacterium]|nr:hypothetical protein [Rhodospirillaceae bacterium]